MPVRREFFYLGNHLAGCQIAAKGNLKRSFCPLARILTFVPPTSTTSTFIHGLSR